MKTNRAKILYGTATIKSLVESGWIVYSQKGFRAEFSCRNSPFVSHQLVEVEGKHDPNQQLRIENGTRCIILNDVKLLTEPTLSLACSRVEQELNLLGIRGDFKPFVTNLFNGFEEGGSPKFFRSSVVPMVYPHVIICTLLDYNQAVSEKFWLHEYSGYTHVKIEFNGFVSLTFTGAECLTDRDFARVFIQSIPTELLVETLPEE